MIDFNPRHWFRKRSAEAGAAGWAEARNRTRYNALFMLDPDVLVRHIAAFAAGDIAGLERVVEEFETRDDKMRVGAFKMASAVASKPWEVRIAKGEEDNARARLHRDILTRFWNRAEATDAFCRNRRGGVRLLVKQMMSAQSRVYSVHDVAWSVRPDGELAATFTHVPAWCFENRTGELRYLRTPGAYTGEPMREGEWLVTVGEGVGISAAILAMAKRLSWNDWMLFSESCGMPVILGNTSAKQGTEAWSALERAVKAVSPKTGLIADIDTRLQAVPMGGSNQSTYRELVDAVDRAISALYRGGDLATMSSTAGDGAGSNSQDGESELMDGDGCAMVSETLHREIDRHVIRFTCGDFEPLAGIVVNPPAEVEDIDRDIRIDTHLAGLGVSLSKADALARYGRTEAADDADALHPAAQAAQPGAPGGFGAFANERDPQTPLQTHAKALQSAAEGSGATGVPPEGAGASAALLRGFAEDAGPAAGRIKSLLDRMDAGEDIRADAAKLAEELPSLMPDDPAMAAVLEEELARAFAEGLASADGAMPLANGTDANGAEHAEAGSGNGGQFVSKGGGSGGSELVKRLTDGATPRSISEEDARAALKEGFSVGGPNGQVNFGEELLKHIDEHGAADAGNRLARLKFAIDTVSDPDTVETSHRGDPRVTRYFKAYDRFGMNVYTDKDGNGIEIAWDLIGKRKERK